MLKIALIAPLLDLLVKPLLNKSKRVFSSGGARTHTTSEMENSSRLNAWRGNSFSTYTDTYISNHFSPLFDISGNKAFMERPISTLL